VSTGKFTDVSDKRGAFNFKQYLKEKAIISFEMSVNLYQWTWCNISEDFDLQQHGSEKLKLHKGHECPNNSFDECHQMRYGDDGINPPVAELNLFCPLLALFGAHHILHVSR
jgi:hypothetical protein